MSSSSSSSELWNYDVFLSFRGEDTRKTFVDHLYSALSRNGIHTYKDDEGLPRGESIAPALFKAIEESRIAVVVFSENYADSSWCLRELAHIMKCKNDRGQLVLPIFHRVNPSDVRNQKRKYEAFAEHESKNSNKVDSWRKALKDAGNLSGWVTEDIENGHESKVIKQIVDEIQDRLFPLDSNDDEDLIGIRARLQDLKSKLEIGSSDVRMVGIWGVGGGGKTTLASSVYREISSKFSVACFIENIREESSKHGLEKLQQKILKHVLKYEVEVERVPDGRRLIKSRLHHKKVLVVLDDVDHLDQLKALAGSHDWFGGGSRIIITTRDEHLLKAHKVNTIYNINLLDDVEANQLFRNHAFSEYISVEDYEMLSKDVISYAGGLPLALKVLGSFLCDKDINDWVSALARLKDIPNEDIMQKLKISYDGLTQVEKELFLDIACFFNGCYVSVDGLLSKKFPTMEVLDACGFYPVIGIKVLMQKALITIDDGRINVHDLIQELGHYIVTRGHPNNSEQHSRVWKREDVRKICDMLATTENHTIEVINISIGFYPESHLMAVSNMKKLRWIDWKFYLPTSLPTTFQPTELCYLKLEYSLLEQLWEGYKYLPSLKLIDLSCSYNLIMTPDLFGLPNLEKMLLNECKHLKEIHPSTGYHEGLVHLDMTGCVELKMFPPIVRMQKLETLLFSGCHRLCKIPDLSRLLCLKNMSLKYCLQLKEIHPSIGYHNGLVYLDMTGCVELEMFPPIVHMQKLETLIFSECRRLCKTPDLSGLPSLQRMLLDDCAQLKEIHRSSGYHEGLVHLDMTGCVELKMFPPIVRMQKLETLLFSGCHRLCKFPEIQVNMDRLKHLNLGNCELKVVPSLVLKYCIRLQALDLSKNTFSRIGSSLLQLHHLKYLNLSSCNSLVELPDLPPSIAILRASACQLLEIKGDFRANCKCLWNVSLCNDRGRGLIGVEKLVRSMLEGNVIEDYFMSIDLGIADVPEWSYQQRGIFRLQLPQNWYIDFTGFLLCFADRREGVEKIIIKKEMDEGYQSDVQVRDHVHKIKVMGSVCFISFNSLRHTAWWDSVEMSSEISFFSRGNKFKVELVPRITTTGDSIGRPKAGTDCSGYYDPYKTFEIQRDSKSSLEITWTAWDYGSSGLIHVR